MQNFEDVAITFPVRCKKNENSLKEQQMSLKHNVYSKGNKNLFNNEIWKNWTSLNAIITRKIILWKITSWLQLKLYSWQCIKQQHEAWVHMKNIPCHCFMFCIISFLLWILTNVSLLQQLLLLELVDNSMSSVCGYMYIYVYVDI